MATIGIGASRAIALPRPIVDPPAHGDRAVRAEFGGELARLAGALDRDVHLGAVVDSRKAGAEEVRDHLGLRALRRGAEDKGPARSDGLDLVADGRDLPRSEDHP